MTETPNTNPYESKTDPTTDEGTLALEDLLNSTKLTTEEKIRIQESQNRDKQTQLESTRQQIIPKLSDKQLENFKSGNLDISHFSSNSLQILIANNFGGKNKELLNILKNWSLDSKIGNYLLSIVDTTKDPLLKKLSAKYTSLQIQKRAKKITISGKNYLTISKRNFSGNEKKLFETKLGKEFLSYSDKIFKAKIVEDFKQKETKVQKDLKELDRSSKIEIYALRQRHFRNAMAIHEPTAEIMKIQRRTLEKKYEIEKAFAKEYIKTTVLLSDNPKTISSKVERQAYWNIDYRNWNGSKTNPNVDDILRDGFAKQFEDNIKKMWEDFQKDPLVGIFDIGKIIGAGAIAGAATILSGGNPLVGGLAFTASDNAIGYVGHGVIGAARGESFIESGNKAIGLYQLDEEGNILKENGKPVFKKGEVIAVEKFGEVAMGIILMGPISKVGGKVTENLAIKGYNVVVSKGVGIGAEALVFNSLNVPFNPIISGASTIADTGDLQKGTQAFETTLKQSLSPANFLSSYVHNIAFIGSLRVGNKLGGEFIAKKFQSKAIETRYNSLTRSYESGIQDLNSEMQKLGFGVIKEGTGYKLVDSNGKPIEAIPESIQTKQKELDKMMMEIIGLSSTLSSIKEEKEGEKEKGKGFMDAVKESYKGSFLASEKGSVSVDLLTLGGAGVVEGVIKGKGETLKKYTNEDAMKLLNDGKGNQVINNFENYGEFNKEVIFKLIEKGYFQHLVDRVDINKYGLNKEIVLHLLEQGSLYHISGDNLKKFKGGLDSEVAIKMIEYGDKYYNGDKEVTKNDKYDYHEKGGNESLFINGIEYFENLDGQVINVLFAKSNNYLTYIANNLNKFSGLDIKNAKILIENGYGDQFINNLKSFNLVLDSGVLVELLNQESNSSKFILKYIDYFNNIGPEEYILLMARIKDNGLISGISIPENFKNEILNIAIRIIRNKLYTSDQIDCLKIFFTNNIYKFKGHLDGKIAEEFINIRLERVVYNNFTLFDGFKFDNPDIARLNLDKIIYNFLKKIESNGFNNEEYKNKFTNFSNIINNNELLKIRLNEIIIKSGYYDTLISGNCFGILSLLENLAQILDKNPQIDSKFFAEMGLYYQGKEMNKLIDWYGTDLNHFDVIINSLNIISSNRPAIDLTLFIDIYKSPDFRKNDLKMSQLIHALSLTNLNLTQVINLANKFPKKMGILNNIFWKFGPEKGKDIFNILMNIPNESIIEKIDNYYSFMSKDNYYSFVIEYLELFKTSGFNKNFDFNMELDRIANKHYMSDLINPEIVNQDLLNSIDIDKLVNEGMLYNSVKIGKNNIGEVKTNLSKEKKQIINMIDELFEKMINNSSFNLKDYLENKIKVIENPKVRMLVIKKILEAFTKKIKVDEYYERYKENPKQLLEEIYDANNEFKALGNSSEGVISNKQDSKNIRLEKHGPFFVFYLSHEYYLKLRGLTKSSSGGFKADFSKIKGLEGTLICIREGNEGSAELHEILHGKHGYSMYENFYGGSSNLPVFSQNNLKTEILAYLYQGEDFGVKFKGKNNKIERIKNTLTEDEGEGGLYDYTDNRHYSKKRLISEKKKEHNSYVSEFVDIANTIKKLYGIKSLSLLEITPIGKWHEIILKPDKYGLDNKIINLESEINLTNVDIKNSTFIRNLDNIIKKSVLENKILSFSSEISQNLQLMNWIKILYITHKENNSVSSENFFVRDKVFIFKIGNRHILTDSNLE